MTQHLDEVGTLYYKHIVHLAEAKWIGIQLPLLAGDTPLVLFNSRKTGTTLALPADEFFTVQAVKQKVKDSDELF